MITPENLAALLQADNEKLALLGLLLGLAVVGGMLSFLFWASRTLIPILQGLREELQHGNAIDTANQQAIEGLRHDMQTHSALLRDLTDTLTTPPLSEGESVLAHRLVRR